MADLPADVSEDMYDRIKEMVKKLKSNHTMLRYLEREFGCGWSLSTLKRRLRSMDIRRHEEVRPIKVMEAVSSELLGPGKRVGYRHMQQRLRMKHNLLVKRDDVYQTMLYLDPDAVRERRQRRYKRRDYVSVGSNWLWHIDGHDKLKPYGFCIHGAIDGFSRKIMWCHIDQTNNDPWYIAKYYFDFVKSEKVMPAMTRSDPGTENGLLATCQMYLRRNGNDNVAAEKSHVYGSSLQNQRIERFWRLQRDHHSGFWEAEFQDLERQGLLVRDCELHRLCLRYVYMPLLREELAWFIREHNSHRIRKQKDRKTPQGVPEDLYAFPEHYGFREAGFQSTEDDILFVEQENGFDQPLPLYIDEDFAERANAFTDEVISIANAREVYTYLVQFMESSQQ